VQNLLQNLSTEQLSLAFQLLHREELVQELPKELENLSLEDWKHVNLLLHLLMQEKQLSSLH
jgi:hypothetical protein